MYAAEFLGITDFGKDDCYILNKDLEHYNITRKQCTDAFISLTKRCKASPDEKTFVLMFWAGHGMCNDGSQMFVLNEYDRT